MSFLKKTQTSTASLLRAKTDSDLEHLAKSNDKTQHQLPTQSFHDEFDKTFERAAKILAQCQRDRALASPSELEDSEPSGAYTFRDTVGYSEYSHFNSSGLPSSSGKDSPIDWSQLSHRRGSVSSSCVDLLHRSPSIASLGGSVTYDTYDTFCKSPFVHDNEPTLEEIQPQKKPTTPSSLDKQSLSQLTSAIQISASQKQEKVFQPSSSFMRFYWNVRCFMTNKPNPARQFYSDTQNNPENAPLLFMTAYAQTTETVINEFKRLLPFAHFHEILPKDASLSSVFVGRESMTLTNFIMGSPEGCAIVNHVRSQDSYEAEALGQVRQTLFAQHEERQRQTDRTPDLEYFCASVWSLDALSPYITNCLPRDIKPVVANDFIRILKEAMQTTKVRKKAFSNNPEACKLALLTNRFLASGSLAFRVLRYNTSQRILVHAYDTMLSLIVDDIRNTFYVTYGSREKSIALDAVPSVSTSCCNACADLFDTVIRVVPSRGTEKENYVPMEIIVGTQHYKIDYKLDGYGDITSFLVKLRTAQSQEDLTNLIRIFLDKALKMAQKIMLHFDETCGRFLFEHVGGEEKPSPMSLYTYIFYVAHAFQNASQEEQPKQLLEELPVLSIWKRLLSDPSQQRLRGYVPELDHSVSLKQFGIPRDVFGEYPSTILPTPHRNLIATMDDLNQRLPYVLPVVHIMKSKDLTTEDFFYDSSSLLQASIDHSIARYMDDCYMITLLKKATEFLSENEKKNSHLLMYMNRCLTYFLLYTSSEPSNCLGILEYTLNPSVVAKASMIKLKNTLDAIELNRLGALEVALGLMDVYTTLPDAHRYLATCTSLKNVARTLDFNSKARTFKELQNQNINELAHITFLDTFKKHNSTFSTFCLPVAEKALEKMKIASSTSPKHEIIATSIVLFQVWFPYCNMLMDARYPYSDFEGGLIMLFRSRFHLYEALLKDSIEIPQDDSISPQCHSQVLMSLKRFHRAFKQNGQELMRRLENI